MINPVKKICVRPTIGAYLISSIMPLFGYFINPFSFNLKDYHSVNCLTVIC